MSKTRQTDLMVVEREQKVAAQKKSEFRCRELDRMYVKSKHKANARRLFLYNEEIKMDLKIKKDNEERAIRMAKVEQDEKLARAMASAKQKELLDTKTKQLMYVKNERERRESELPLRKANFINDLGRQVKEKEVVAREEKVKTHYEILQILDSRDKEKKVEDELDARNHEELLELIEANKKQALEDAEKKRQSKAEAGETPLLMHLKNTTTTRDRKITREELDECVRTKKKFKEIELADAIKMDKRVEEYLSMVEKRNREHAEKNKPTGEKERIYQKLVGDLQSIRSDRWDTYDALAETKLEEQHYDFYAAEARDKELNKTRQKEQLDMKKTDLQIHQDRRRAEKERELADELKLLKYYQHDNDSEANEAMQKRSMEIEYRKELKKAIDQKREAKKLFAR